MLVSAALLSLVSAAALAQGTKDPSNPGPSMVFTVQPPGDASQPTTVPTIPPTRRPTTQLRPLRSEQAGRPIRTTR